MKIDVFGAILIDEYIDDAGKKTESIGGSGLNIARGLHLLGHDIRYFSNIGSDEKKDTILKELKNNNFSIEGISIKQGMTGVFTSQNDKMIAVDRGVNAMPLTIDTSLLRNECAIITTELQESSLEKILSYPWRQIFLDIGPRPYILSTIPLPKNCITLGNILESKKFPCQIVKLGPAGAKWDNIVVKGNNTPLPYTIGAGDVFDTILIDNILNGKDRKTSLETALEYAEKSCNIQNSFKLAYIV